VGFLHNNATNTEFCNITDKLAAVILIWYIIYIALTFLALAVVLKQSSHESSEESKQNVWLTIRIFRLH